MSFDAFSITEDKIDINDAKAKDELISAEIQHTHQDPPTKLEKISCRKCIIEEADASILQRLTDMKTKPTIQQYDNESKAIKTYEVSKIVVKRGFLDDCIGTDTNWSKVA